MSVSLIVTSAHEPQTIGNALEAIIKQDSQEIIEILVVSPDQETATVVQNNTNKFPKIHLIKDKGEGKPQALNLAFQKAKGEIFILTDGDVQITQGSLKELLKPFFDPSIGGVGGHPLPINSKDNLLGFWAHFLTEAAHKIRLDRLKKDQFLELSGYLLAIKKSCMTLIPPGTLADDSFLSHLIARSNFKTAYAPEAKVLVKFPTTLSDWFKQKRRSSFEYWKNHYPSDQTMRSPLKEVSWGFKFALEYPKNLKESFWLGLLFGARVVLWLQIVFLSLFPRSSNNLWVQIKSTK